MPEGPSIVIAKEILHSFEGMKIISASGSAALDYEKMTGQKIKTIDSWGKHLLICFDGFFIRIHLLMFGTYLINERKELSPKLSIQFNKGELNFYTCSIKQIEKAPVDIYDWERDIMSPKWNTAKALLSLKEKEGVKVCDVLLDQELFSGVGNIIKNEALFRAKIHPESLVENIPTKNWKVLIQETQHYSFDFYTWRKEGTLKKHWLVYQKKNCPVCSRTLLKKELGKTKRWTFFCTQCQIKY